MSGSSQRFTASASTGPTRDRLLEMTQLTAFRSRRADQLSGGMKQKLALACTLVHAPRILLLDEPTTGVDPVSRREFWKLLSEFLASGLTIVMATPYLDEAERCGRVALLHDGRLLAIDRPAALQGSIGRLLEVSVESAEKALRGAGGAPRRAGRSAIRRPGPRPAPGSGDRGRDARDRGRTRGQRDSVQPSSVRLPASLEDVFIELIGTSRAGREAA